MIAYHSNEVNSHACGPPPGWAQYAFITGGARRYLALARTARLVSEPILPSNPAA
jgi:hypothetical protein